MTLRAPALDPVSWLLDQRGGQQEVRPDLTPEALERHRELLPVLHAQGRAARGAAVRALAEARGITTQAVNLQVREFERRGLQALQRGTRSDAGGVRVPQEALQVIVTALVSNPPTTSGRMIWRTLVRAVPELMTVTRAGRETTISADTVLNIRRQMVEHPEHRLLFMDGNERKEFLRTYAGTVVAGHANGLWQLDMTRCDIWVMDPETGRIYRPRVQAVIDTYSGCIMGISFGEAEDQTQADLALYRAVLRKGGPLRELYPVYGIPQRLYIDNGKTYSSAHFHRIGSELGIEIVHSRPRVSHTRGKIERFFGTLHGLERALPGYAGENASKRSDENLKRYRAAAERWHETGRDPGQHARLLTIQEYQATVLAWLVSDYHQTVVNGRTRLEHWLETAPASTRLDVDRTELLLLFAHREERKVTPGATVSVDGRQWTLPEGALAPFKGMVVLVLTDRMVLGEAIRGIAWRERNGKLRMLGEAVPAPTVADSIEAADARRAGRAAKRDALRAADDLRGDLRDPGLMVGTALQKSLSVAPVTPVLPAGRARLEAVSGKELPQPSAEARDLFGAVNGDDVPDNLDDLKTWLKG